MLQKSEISYDSKSKHGTFPHACREPSQCDRMVFSLIWDAQELALRGILSPRV